MFVAAVMIGSPAAYAVQPDKIMADPAKEARARDLSRELRCMVCQNQSIDYSEAPLARDLRLLVRERIAAGDSNSQVIDFLVARYGEFVLLKPRFNPHRWCCGCCRRWRWPAADWRCGSTAAAAQIRAPSTTPCSIDRRGRGKAGAVDRGGDVAGQASRMIC